MTNRSYWRMYTTRPASRSRSWKGSGSSRTARPKGSSDRIGAGTWPALAASVSPEPVVAWLMVVMASPRLGMWSEVENKAVTAGPRDADKHRLASLPLVLGQQRVAMVRLAGDDTCLAGAADALAAGGQHRNTGFRECVDDRLVGSDRDDRSRRCQLDLECSASYGCRWCLRHEPLDTKGAVRQLDAGLRDGGEQRRRPAAVHTGPVRQRRDGLGEVEQSELVLRHGLYAVAVLLELVQIGHRGT